jgi:hypothetical protein
MCAIRRVGSAEVRAFDGVLLSNSVWITHCESYVHAPATWSKRDIECRHLTEIITAPK